MKRSRQCFSVSAYVHEGFGQSERWVERDGALGAPGLDDDVDGFAGAVAEGVGYAGRAGDCEAAGADKPFDDRFQNAFMPEPLRSLMTVGEDMWSGRAVF
jgi:hypothetical protein